VGREKRPRASTRIGKRKRDADETGAIFSSFLLSLLFCCTFLCLAKRGEAKWGQGGYSVPPRLRIVPSSDIAAFVHTYIY